MSDQNVKRQLCGLPSGKNTLADMHFIVRHIAPQVEGKDLTDEFQFATAIQSPYQDMTEAAPRWLAGA